MICCERMRVCECVRFIWFAGSTYMHKHIHTHWVREPIKWFDVADDCGTLACVCVFISEMSAFSISFDVVLCGLCLSLSLCACMLLLPFVAAPFTASYTTFSVARLYVVRSFVRLVDAWLCVCCRCCCRCFGSMALKAMFTANGKISKTCALHDIGTVFL